jgi:hypothetical protein
MTGDRNLLMIDIARVICPNGTRRGLCLFRSRSPRRLLGFLLGIWYATN